MTKRKNIVLINDKIVDKDDFKKGVQNVYENLQKIRVQNCDKEQNCKPIYFFDTIEKCELCNKLF